MVSGLGFARPAAKREENEMTLRATLTVGASVMTLFTIGSGGTSSSPTADASSARTTPGLVTFRVPSVSMLPTLKVGSSISVDLHAYRTRRPQIGDIVVFHPPRGADALPPVCGVAREGGSFARPCGVPTRRRSSEKSVKRVVGLPGDRISIVNGHVIRNGVREHDPYIVACADSSSCNFRKPVVTPHGDYFMLGDNRAQSDDSRFWGPVRTSWILGKVIAHSSTG
jgi:signal peptidase I